MEWDSISRAETAMVALLAIGPASPRYAGRADQAARLSAAYARCSRSRVLSRDDSAAASMTRLAVVSASRGELSLVYAFPVATTERWRVTFDLDIGPPDGPQDPIDLRLYLARDGEALSETWLYQAFPSQLHRLLGEHA